MNLLSGVNQDFHRSLKAPGAYEWWHFDGTDDQTGYSFSIQFSAGNLFSAYYQDSLKTYWQKTKSPLLEGSAQAVPPNPMDFCGVAFRIFHQGLMVGEALQEFPAHFLKASDQTGAVLLGPSRFNWDERGDPPSYVVTVQAPIRGGKKLLRARLFFTPRKGELLNLPQPEIHSTHTWVLAAPLCHVEGTLEWCNRDGNVEKEQGFVGRGYHDHHFGTVPLDRFVKAWHWGRAFVGERVFIYSIQRPPEEEESAEGIILVFNNGKPEIFTRETISRLHGKKRNFFLLPYEKALSFLELHTHGRLHLLINHRQILSDGPASLIFQDQVHWTHEGKGQEGSGMSNYLYTPRLSSRFFFPLLKGKTSVFTRRDEEPAPRHNDSGDVTTTRPSL